MSQKQKKSLVVWSVAIFAIGVFLVVFQFVHQQERFEKRVSMILGGFTEKTFAESLGTGSYGGCYNISFGTSVPGDDTTPGDLCAENTIAPQSICIMENESVQVNFSGATNSDNVYTDQLSVNQYFSEYQNNFENGNLGALTTSGDGIWTVTSGPNTHNGSFSAQSGSIGDSQESRLRYDFTIDSPSYLEFTFRVSSEEWADYGRFFLNGVEQFSHSGNYSTDGEWRSYSIQIPTPGTYYAEWVYEKDASWSDGDDMFQVDDVEILSYDPSFPPPTQSNGFAFNSTFLNHGNGNDTITFSPTLTAPEVTSESDFVFEFGGEFNGSPTWSGNTRKTAQLNVKVENVNNNPVIDAISPESLEYEVDNIGDTYNLPVEVSLSDADGDTMDVIFELSNDDFATVLQSQSYVGQDISNPVTHTFTNLEADTYTWRVRADESVVDDYCVGYSNESSASLITVSDTSGEISITEPPAPEPEPEVETNPFTARVIGTVYSDDNGNGAQDANERGLPNVTVFAEFDKISASNESVPEGKQRVESETNDQGVFELNVPPGKVRIIIDKDDPDIPAGSVVTAGALEREFDVVEGVNNVDTGFNVPRLEETSAKIFGVVAIGGVMAFASQRIRSMKFRPKPRM